MHKLDQLAQQDQNHGDIDISEIHRALEPDGVLGNKGEIAVLVGQLEQQEHVLEEVLYGSLRVYLEGLSSDQINAFASGSASKQDAKLFQFACHVLFGQVLAVDGIIGSESLVYSKRITASVYCAD